VRKASTASRSPRPVPRCMKVKMSLITCVDRNTVARLENRRAADLRGSHHVSGWLFGRPSSATTQVCPSGSLVRLVRIQSHRTRLSYGSAGVASLSDVSSGVMTKTVVLLSPFPNAARQTIASGGRVRSVGMNRAVAGGRHQERWVGTKLNRAAGTTAASKRVTQCDPDRRHWSSCDVIAQIV
jgi:hypothetical protein